MVIGTPAIEAFLDHGFFAAVSAFAGITRGLPQRPPGRGRFLPGRQLDSAMSFETVSC